MGQPYLGSSTYITSNLKVLNHYNHPPPLCCLSAAPLRPIPTGIEVTPCPCHDRSGELRGQHAVPLIWPAFSLSQAFFHAR